MGTRRRRRAGSSVRRRESASARTEDDGLADRRLRLIIGLERLEHRVHAGRQIQEIGQAAVVGELRRQGIALAGRSGEQVHAPARQWRHPRGVELDDDDRVGRPGRRRGGVACGVGSV